MRNALVEGEAMRGMKCGFLPSEGSRHAYTQMQSVRSAAFGHQQAKLLHDPRHPTVVVCSFDSSTSERRSGRLGTTVLADGGSSSAMRAIARAGLACLLH